MLEWPGGGSTSGLGMCLGNAGAVATEGTAGTLLSPEEIWSLGLFLGAWGGWAPWRPGPWGALGVECAWLRDGSEASGSLIGNL